MRRYIAFMSKGPQWDEDKSLYEQGAPVEGHLTAMRSRFDAGQLLFGGPFDEGDGIAVLNVPDKAAARELMDADPAVRAGVIVYDLKTLRPLFDATLDIRTEGTAAEVDPRNRRS